MNIKINNYKNLKNLNCDIQNGKINYIFGISGSGKSSIGEALYGEEIQNNVSIGQNIDEVEILIDNCNVQQKINIYNSNSVDKLLVNNTDNSFVYNIIFDNNNKIIKLQEEFKSKIKELIDFKNIIYEYISKVDILNKAIGGKLTKTNRLPSSSKIIKLENAVSLEENKDIVSVIKDKGNWYLPWIKLGSESNEYKLDICPFCGKSISIELKEQISSLLKCNDKDFEAMFQEESILTNLEIEVPDYSNVDEIKALKDAIISKLMLKKELLSIIDFIDFYDNPNFNPSTLSEIVLSKDLKEIFPEIVSIINQVNSSIKEIKRTLGKLRTETNSTISHNLNNINTYLKKFGINYGFDINSYSNSDGTLNYSLFHLADEEKNNRVNGLSFGEKNLISLLLFLLSSKEEFIIIDDPASSFDDYRRKVILDLIYDICCGKTVLILSHDQVFIKYATFNYTNSKKIIESGRNVSSKIEKYHNNTGSILALENYFFGNAKIKEIKFEDFKHISMHILNSICEDMEYYRKVLNLRLYYECEKSVLYKDEYEYLSAIYHKKTQIEILSELSKRGLTEESVISKINSKTGILLPKVPNDDYFNINVDKLTLFEKVLYYRESKTGEIKEDFSSVVHMNESLQICLNPYKFNYFSPFIYNNLK